MAWPTATIDTSQMDAGTDSPATARPQIKQMADSVNTIKDAKGVASGIAELDSGGKVLVSQLPTVPANKGGTGQTSYSIGDLLYASAASALSKLGAGTSGYVLKSNGPGAVPSWQDAGTFPAGTRMIFQQTAAPTEWTKETNGTYNDISLRVVTGAVGGGGANVFSSVFSGSKSTEGFTLGTAHIPWHPHDIPLCHNEMGAGMVTQGNTPTGTTTPTNGVGGGGAHSHTISNFNLKYSDVIIAFKS